jgi:DNA-binding NarL/FixJ family response regulator
VVSVGGVGAAVVDASDGHWPDALLRLDRHLRQAEQELHSVRSYYDALLRTGPLTMPAPTVRRPSVTLTTSECRVALLVSNGSSNEQVAEKLRVSVHTVKSQLQSIYRKLGIHSRWLLADWSGE